jgi:hypothetical protein
MTKGKGPHLGHTVFSLPQLLLLQTCYMLMRAGQTKLMLETTLHGACLESSLSSQSIQTTSANKASKDSKREASYRFGPKTSSQNRGALF